ncbi:MAG: hypothetical protein CK425_05195 [Parachlamydia sp.]|nr:MAG: hypothetical protein CK425_05195 [Parachlamydia sp.]
MLKIQKNLFFEAFPEDLPLRQHYWIVREGKKIRIRKILASESQEKFPSVACQVYNLKLLIKNRAHTAHDRYRLKQIAARIGKEHAVYEDSLIKRIRSACINFILGYSLQSTHAILREIKKQKISSPPPTPEPPISNFTQFRTPVSTNDIPPAPLKALTPALQPPLAPLDLESTKALLARLTQGISTQEEPDYAKLLKSLSGKNFLLLMREDEKNYCLYATSYPDSSLKLIFNILTTQQLTHLIFAGFQRGQPPPLNYFLNLIRGIYFCEHRQKKLALTIRVMQALHRQEWLKLSLEQLSKFIIPHTDIQCQATLSFLHLYIMGALNHPKLDRTFLLLNFLAEVQLPYLVAILRGVKGHIEPFNRIKMPLDCQKKLHQWSMQQRRRCIQTLVKNAYPQTTCVSHSD